MKYVGSQPRVKNLIFPNTVKIATMIGGDVESDAEDHRNGTLENVQLSENLTEISDGIFKNCLKLNNITIPEGVTSIGDYAFSGCSSLSSITIPEGVTSIGDRVV